MSRTAALGAFVLLLASCPRAAVAQVFLPGGAGSRQVRGELGAYRERTRLELQQLLDGWRGAWNGDDVEGVLELLTRDALLVLPGGAPLRGVEAVRDALAAHLAVDPALDLRLLDFATSGDLAYIACEAAPRAPAEEAPPRLLVVIGLRGEDNRWRIRSLSLTGRR